MTVFLQQIVNGLSQGATYAMIALGFGLVFSVMRVINVAHPDIFMVATYISYATATFLITSMRQSLAIVLLLTVVSVLVGTTLLGLVLERTVIRPLRGRYILMPFIATAGASIVLRNTVQRLFGPDPRPLPALVPDRVFHVYGTSATLRQLLVILSAIVVLVMVSYYVRRTRWGRATRAVAEKPGIAAAWVDTNRVSQLNIGLASFTAGLAGLTVGFLLNNASPFVGELFGVKAFVCMLVAGNRSVEGIMAIGLALGVVEALVGGYISSNFRDAIAFALLLAILFFRPAGIFGSYEV